MSNQKLTPLEVEFFRFLHSGTHETVEYCPIQKNVWYKRRNSTDHERVKILTIAHNKIRHKSNKMKAEGECMNLFNDLKQNETHWFDEILSNPYNFGLFDPLMVCVGTLTTCKRNRLEMEVTQELLSMYTRIYHLMKVKVETEGFIFAITSDVHETFDNFAGLEYKYRLIHMNILIQLRKLNMLNSSDPDMYKNEVTRLYRHLMEYEIRYPNEPEGAIYTTVLPDLLPYYKEQYSLSDLAKVSDDALFAMNLLITEERPLEDTIDNKLGRQAKLKACTVCNHVESYRGEFKTCGVCKGPRYCSKGACSAVLTTFSLVVEAEFIIACLAPLHDFDSC